MSRNTIYPVILNQSNLIQNGSNLNTYRYQFPGSVPISNSKIAVANIQMFYSWYNISSESSNTSYQIIFPTLAGTTTLNINMPDGYYSVSSLNSYLQSQFISAGLYLVNDSGNYIYYVQFAENPTYYSIQLNVFPVPTTLPVNWTNPGGMTFPVSSTTPQLTVLANNFRYIIGFNAGNFPSTPQIVNSSTLSTFTPQVSTVSSVILTCSMLKNKYANPSTVLYSFSAAGTEFGNQINISPNQYSFVDVYDSNYASFDIQFLDQSYNALKINDTNLIIQLLISSND